jgi:hypothetical protein
VRTGEDIKKAFNYTPLPSLDGRGEIRFRRIKGRVKRIKSPPPLPSPIDGEGVFGNPEENLIKNNN